MKEIKRAMRICRNGHVKKIGPNPVLTGSIDQIDTDIENEVRVGRSFCSECGEQVIFSCEQCDSPIEVGSSWSEDFDELPSYCAKCSEPYPWTNTIEEVQEREDEFLEIDDRDIDGQFYPNLVYEINLCYSVKADDATMVLTRKLVENLLLDIIRGRFGMDSIELFYDPDYGQHKGLKELIRVFDENQNEFDQFSTAHEGEIVERLNKLKTSGDASAHSIESSINEEILSSRSEDATRVVKLLFRLRNEIKTVHRR